jgi:hypothetical protein
VEMTAGRGEVIKFAAGPDGKIDSLDYSGTKFVR